ncbi:MAG: efflux RND transporter periplasmic adaptor subunit [Bacteroidia bacterium]|nr:efflux RND transporter periplasmic adaptor subunit [Bacteroidia bacterium]
MKTLCVSMAFATAALCVACGKEAEEEVENERFCLTDTLKARLTLAEAQIENVKHRLVLSGKVMVDENRRSKLFPQVSGVVEDLKVQLGDYVTKGQVMAVIRSREVADIESQLISAQAQLIAAEKNESVQEDLFRAGLAAEKDLINARSERQKAESEVKRLRDAYQILGADNHLYYMRAPISGFVIEKNPSVSENMQYNEQEIGSFFTIADISDVYITANVYETDVAKIKLGYDAHVRLVAYPDKVYHGKVDKILNVIDPETRVMQIRIRLSNPDFSIKPEMFAQVTLTYVADDAQVSIPSQAVIFDKNRHYVVVYNGDCDLSIREIQILVTTDQTTYVKSGVSPGEKVMTKNHLLVYEELSDRP